MVSGDQGGAIRPGFPARGGAIRPGFTSERECDSQLPAIVGDGRSAELLGAAAEHATVQTQQASGGCLVVSGLAQRRHAASALQVSNRAVERRLRVQEQGHSNVDRCTV